MEEVHNELCGLLCIAGAAVVFFVFVGIASNYFAGPDWLWYVVGFVGLFWMEFLIHEKFDSSRLRSEFDSPPTPLSHHRGLNGRSS